MNTDIFVEKADGTKEPFNEEKLRTSLKNAGASGEEADKIVEHIHDELVPGVTTENIYKHAFSFLRHMRVGLAARYSLRKSLAKLGPSGYPFELFVAELLTAEGYKAEPNKFLNGKCAEHEVDVIAQNAGEFIMAEVKFHNQSRIKSDLKVALYVQARFEDLLETNFDGKMSDGLIPEGWLITNTKFTSHASKYGECVNLRLVGWSYPNKNNLQDMITRHNLEPLTTLTTLEGREKKELMKNGHVLCKTIHDDRQVLQEVGLTKDRVEKVLEEAHNVCY